MTDRNPRKPEIVSRRSFLSKLWLWLGLAAGVELMGGLFLALRHRSRNKSDDLLSGLINAGQVDSYKNESVTAFIQGKFYLCRLEDGGFIALSRKCTHLGCIVPWNAEEQKFICPCHASAFNIRGEVKGTPAPRPLDVFRVRIENHQILVESSTPVRRSEFHPEQVVHPEVGLG